MGSPASPKTNRDRNVRVKRTPDGDRGSQSVDGSHIEDVLNLRRVVLNQDEECGPETRKQILQRSQLARELAWQEPNQVRNVNDCVEQLPVQIHRPVVALDRVVSQTPLDQAKYDQVIPVLLARAP